MDIHQLGAEMVDFSRLAAFRNCEERNTILPSQTAVNMTGILSALRFPAGLLFAALMLSACTEGPAASNPETPPPQEVSVLELKPAPLPVIRELPGRIAPTRIAEVR